MRTDETLLLIGVGALAWLLFLKPRQLTPQEQLWQNVGSLFGIGGNTTGSRGLQGLFAPRAGGAFYAPPEGNSYPSLFDLRSPLATTTAAAIDPVTTTPGLALTSDNTLLAIDYTGATSTGQPAVAPNVETIVPTATPTGVPPGPIQNIEAWNAGGPVYNGNTPPTYNPPALGVVSESPLEGAFTPGGDPWSVGIPIAIGRQPGPFEIFAYDAAGRRTIRSTLTGRDLYIVGYAEGWQNIGAA